MPPTYSSAYATPFGQQKNRLSQALNQTVYRRPPQAAPIHPALMGGVTPAAPVAAAAGIPGVTPAITNPLAQAPTIKPPPGQPPITTGPYGTFGQYPTAPYAGTTPTAIPPSTGASTAIGGTNAPWTILSGSLPGIGGPGGVPNLNLGAIYSNALASDPVYAQALQMANSQRQMASSGFLNQLKQELIGYGSSDYAHKVLDPLRGQLGKYVGDLKLNDEFWKSISANPETSFSTLGQLNRETPKLLNQTTENVNKANLFYGGHGAQAISDQTYQNQKAYSEADRAIQKTIAGDRQMFQGTMAGIDTALAAAAEGAYMRALQQAYAYGIGGNYGQGQGQGQSTGATSAEVLGYAGNNYPYPYGGEPAPTQIPWWLLK